MTNPLNSTASQNVGLLLARLPLGAYLLIVGYQHFSGGVNAFASQNQAALTHYMSTGAASGILRAMPFLELAAGAFLMLGVFSRTGGFLASLVLITVLCAITGVRGGGGMPFAPQLVFCGLALYLCVAGAGGFSVDRLVWGNKSKR